MTPEMRRWISNALSRARAATSLEEVHALAATLEVEADEQVSQARTCSTCRHRGTVTEYRLQSCLHPESPITALNRRWVNKWGCLLWEQADPKEPA
jgi:hypothetical protein